MLVTTRRIAAYEREERRRLEELRHRLAIRHQLGERGRRELRDDIVVLRALRDAIAVRRVALGAHVAMFGVR